MLTPEKTAELTTPMWNLLRKFQEEHDLRMSEVSQLVLHVVAEDVAQLGDSLRKKADQLEALGK